MTGFDVVIRQGLVAPAGTPSDIIAKLHQEILRIYALPDAKERIAAAGLDPVTSTPAEFSAYIRVESERWGKAIKEAVIRLD